MRSWDRCQLGLPFPLLGISRGEGHVCGSESQGGSVHTFPLALVNSGQVQGNCGHLVWPGFPLDWMEWQPLSTALLSSPL